MKKIFILFLTFLPIILLGQQLECCESKKDVETHLNGDWKMKNSDLQRIYRYQFMDNLGKFQVLSLIENGELEEVKENFPTLRILKSEKGFEIEHDFGITITSAKILFLDATKLTVARQDGKETEYYKISQ